jgi:CubicO group peptidase (beta-lactamase class C family)
MGTFARVGIPEEMGLSSQAVLRFFERQADLGIHSLALVRDHKAYAISVSPWREDLPHTLFSLSKSFCSMAAGLAVSEGLLSYEDSVADVLRDSLPKGYDTKLHEVRLRHLLSMSSGLDEKSDQRSLRLKKDWAREVLGFRVLHEPGTRFRYHTLGTYLAGRMVAVRAGMSLRDYLMPRLFLPLGIAKPQWDCCPMGYNTAGFGLHLSVLDLALAAQLMLNKGRWGERQLLPPDYLAQATVKQIDNLDLKAKDRHPDWESGYGWQFWLARNGRYRGDGMYGQVMMVDEGRNLAIAVTAGLNRMGDELDALHALMDELLTLPPADIKEQETLKSLRLAVPEPKDAGGALFGEGSYFTADGRALRLETPDDETLRVFYTGRGAGRSPFYTFGRTVPHHGEFYSPAAGERPQPYLGRFGVSGGAITAQALMPQAPYSLRLRITRETDGTLQVDMKSVGSDEGQFRFEDAKK